jgi:hypothetical protein
VIGVVSVFALAEPKVAEGVVLHGFGSLAMGRLNGVGRLERGGVVKMGVHEGADGTERPGRVGQGVLQKLLSKPLEHSAHLKIKVEVRAWGGWVVLASAFAFQLEVRGLRAKEEL